MVSTGEIQVHGCNGLQPIKSFRFCPQVQKLVKGFQQPTAIQSYCIPSLLAGRDVIGIAETGSGKTLAFALPILQLLLENKPDASLAAVVLSPTRELAQQTFRVFSDVVKSVCVYGGASRHEQKAALREGPAVLVGTPGRVIDFLDEKALDLSKVRFLVLDEADRMLDFGFCRDIRRIAEALPALRQTVMFSATWPASIQAIAEAHLRPDTIKIVVGGQDRAASSVSQIVEVLDGPHVKEERLLQVLAERHCSRRNRVLVFALYKKEAERLELFLNRRGWKAASVHGDKPQSERNRAIDRFRDGSWPLLVATDVAARGLDIPQVEFVINYTFPLTIQDYIHRIGRTGRAGQCGTAITFFTPLDKPQAAGLANVLRDAGLEPPPALLRFGGATKRKLHKDYGVFFKEIDATGKKSTHVKFDDEE